MEQSDKLRSLFFQESDLYLSIYDKDLNCLDFNDAFLSVFQCERKDLLGKNLCEISPDLKINGRYDLYKEVIRTGNVIEIDHMQPHPTIGNYHFRIRAFKVGDGLGLLVKDITDLVELTERFKYATNASKEIIYEWNLNNDSVMFNDSYFELMALENKTNPLSRSNWTTHIHPEDVAKVQNSLDDFLHQDKNYWSNEYRFIGKNNQLYYFAERAFMIRDRKGKPAKMIASVTDITYWQLNINHLEEMLFTLSHKVRQPVSNILGISMLLDYNLMKKEELKTIVGYMKKSANLLDVFVSEMTSLIYNHKEKTAEKNWN
ncbi:MAG: PAS domain-containing protein [Bacteroidota bacterium]|nr:PAS domain-containing protein [Bacteroidota bacterium]